MPDPAMVFDLFDCFRREIFGCLDAHYFARTNLSEIPTQKVWRWA